MHFDLILQPNNCLALTFKIALTIAKGGYLHVRLLQNAVTISFQCVFLLEVMEILTTLYYVVLRNKTIPRATIKLFTALFT